MGQGPRPLPRKSPFAQMLPRHRPPTRSASTPARTGGPRRDPRLCFAAERPPRHLLRALPAQLFSGGRQRRGRAHLHPQRTASPPLRFSRVQDAEGVQPLREGARRLPAGFCATVSTKTLKGRGRGPPARLKGARRSRGYRTQRGSRGPLCRGNQHPPSDNEGSEDLHGSCEGRTRDPSPSAL